MIKKNLFTYHGQKHPVYTIGTGSIKILVLHGWGSKLLSWQSFFTVENQNKYTFYFPELPGFGDSPKPKQAWDVQAYLDYVKAVYKWLDDKPDYLLTHSLGGRIAIKWLSQDPGVFKHAFLIAAAGIKPHKNILKRTIEFCASRLKKYEKGYFFSAILVSLKNLTVKLLKAQDYQNSKELMKQSFLKVVDEDLTGSLVHIQDPVELIWGKNDAYTPLYMGRIMNDLIPNSHLTIIKEARHGVHMQSPAKLSLILDKIIFNRT